jgi:hypothetical protein
MNFLKIVAHLLLILIFADSACIKRNKSTTTPVTPSTPITASSPTEMIKTTPVSFSGAVMTVLLSNETSMINHETTTNSSFSAGINTTIQTINKTAQTTSLSDAIIISFTNDITPSTTETMKKSSSESSTEISIINQTTLTTIAPYLDALTISFTTNKITTSDMSFSVSTNNIDLFLDSIQSFYNNRSTISTFEYQNSSNGYLLSNSLTSASPISPSLQISTNVLISLNRLDTFQDIGCIVRGL